MITKVVVRILIRTHCDEFNRKPKSNSSKAGEQAQTQNENIN